MRALIIALSRNTVSLVGAALATASGVLSLALLALDLSGNLDEPYHGIIVYLFLPALFVLGLLLIPIDFVLERRRARRSPVARAGESRLWSSISISSGPGRSSSGSCC